MAQQFFTGALVNLATLLGTEQIPYDAALGGSGFFTSNTLIKTAANAGAANDTGAVNAMVVTFTGVAAQADILGRILKIYVANTNTVDTPTLNVNSFGAQNVVSVGAGGVAGVGSGTCAAGKIIDVVWDGTNYQMLGRLATASVAEIQAGTDFKKPIASSGLRAAMAFNLAAGSGYQYLPTGMIIQWGTFTTVTGINDALAFPITFPTAVVSFVATATVVGAPMVSFVGSGGITTAGVALGTGNLTTAPPGASGAGVPVRWIAIGY